MHRLIRVLVFAPDADGALDAAHEVVHEKLKTTSEGGPYDYYVDFTECPKEEPGMRGEEVAAIALSGNNGCSFQARFGKNRWGPIQPVLQVSTVRFPIEDPRGLEQAREAFDLIREEFNDNMLRIRYHIANYTDDELFREVPGKGGIEIDGVEQYDDPRLFQYFCEEISGRSPYIGSYLYDFKGNSVTRLAHLKGMITDSDENPHYMDESGGEDPDWGRHIWNRPLWIVPFDVHS